MRLGYVASIQMFLSEGKKANKKAVAYKETKAIAPKIPNKMEIGEQRLHLAT